MVVVDLQWIKGTQFFADNGAILDSGTINVYDATTTSLRTTYSNYLGTIANTLNGSNQIVLDDAGRLTESVYIPTGLWKFILKDSAGNTIATEDNIEGALDTDALTITAALPSTPVISKTSDYTIVVGDQGNIINANPTGGAFVLTLPSAATAGDGWRITIRHVGTANQVTIVGVVSQTINGSTSRALGAQFETLCLVSDGANWHIDGHAQGFNYGQVPFFFVESRTLTTPPTNPTAGARYIVASGTPTGSWAAYSTGDVAESDGQGGWIRLVPTEGWTAYDKTANQHCLFVTAWEGLPSTDDPAASDLGYAVFSDTKTSGTEGGTGTTTTWTTRTLNTSEANTITGVSLATNQITLPAGTYLVFFNTTFYKTAGCRARLRSTTSATAIYSVNGTTAAADTIGITLTGVGRLELSAEEIFDLQYYIGNSQGTSDLGVANSISSVSEVYSRVTIIDLSSLQGPQGDQGEQGPEGFAGFKYTFSSTTSMSDPGAGLLRLNNATLASVTAVAIDDTSAATGNPDVSNEILSWDDSSSTNKGKLKISKIGAPENFAIYTITSLTDNSGWTQLAVTHVTSAGTIANTDSVSVEFIEKGDKGDTGSTGPTGSTTFNFDNATADADPGSGELRLNNATPASATAAYIDNNNRGGSAVTTWLDSFDDSGASANRGTLVIADATNPATVFHIYKVTGSIVDGTGYRKVTISTLGGAGSFTDGNELLVSFFPAGATGAMGGTTGATDERVLRSDGTGGATVQNSPVSIDDSGNMSGVATLTTTGGIELGHASDTTIARVGAARAAIEGREIETISVVALSDGATPALDASLGSVFTLAAAGDRTIAVPTNPTNGQKIVIRHLASGGARTLALNTGAGGFRFGTDITGLTETTSGKIDYIGAIYNGTDSRWDVVAYAKGF